MNNDRPEEAIDAVHSLAVREDTGVAVWVPTFAVAVDEMVAKVDAKRDFFRRVMRDGEHYGVIPGTGTKPTLLKPGAELLNSAMGLNVELTDAEPPTIDYGTDGKEGLIRFRRVCRIYRQTGPGENDRMKVAQAEGSCSSREAKYRYRSSKRVCPACGKDTIINGKPEYNHGIPNFVCFKKKGGCGTNFAVDDPAITSQAEGKTANLDLADVENTILKMADKRAMVAATLLATGTSDIFTQDVEDGSDPPEPVEPPQTVQSRPSVQRQAEPPKQAPEVKEPTETAFDRGAAQAKIEKLVKDGNVGSIAMIEIIKEVTNGGAMFLQDVRGREALLAVHAALKKHIGELNALELNLKNEGPPL